MSSKVVQYVAIVAHEVHESISYDESAAYLDFIQIVSYSDLYRHWAGP